MDSIIYLIPWFGRWPAWFPLFLESCRYNATIDFALITDCPAAADMPPNVRIVATSFADYRAHIADTLKIRPKWDSPYKLCDFKPVLGALHRDLVAGHDFWGYGDVDIIFGDLRAFLTPEVLRNDVVSTHEHIVAGHLATIRTTERLLTAYRRPLHWRWLLEAAKHKSFDERIFSMLFLPEARKGHGFHRFMVPQIGSGLFREQFSTPLEGLHWIDGSKNFPRTWYWNRGHLTADNSGDREFMYLHFTHWASKRWTGGDTAVWDRVDPLVQVTDPHPASFKISAQGFQPWSPDEAHAAAAV